MTPGSRSDLPTALRTAHARVLAAIARLDPNDDPGADPVGVLPLAALVVALSISLGAFLRYPIQPMQDLGHHLALTAVVSDLGRAGSVFTELYEPLDRLAANSLLYSLAAPLGRLIGVTAAVRACVGFYVVGLPLAVLWALRVYGRSAWGAVIAVPLVYDMVYVAGFANLLFAAPFMVLALPVLHRALERRTLGWMLGAAALYVVVFLSHAHAFLWTGALSAALAVGLVIAPLFRGGATPRERLRDAATTAGLALLAVTPSLLLFARWYRRTFGEGRTSGGVTAATATAADKFGAVFKPIGALFTDLWHFAAKLFSTSDRDLQGSMRLVVLGAIAVALSRLHRYRRPPVLELACAATIASYFVLPEGLTGHDVLGSRQISVALWFLPVLLVPVPARTSRVAHVAVVVGILYVTGYLLAGWKEQLVAFQRETAGLRDVLSKAPPRQWLHYVKLAQNSEVFTWRQFLHVDKFYSSDALGQIADTPAILSTSPIRYRAGVEIHRIGDHSWAWPNNDEIWKNFDLVLVHKWSPSADLLAKANEKGELVAKSGDWELWRSKKVDRQR